MNRMLLADNQPRSRTVISGVKSARGSVGMAGNADVRGGGCGCGGRRPDCPAYRRLLRPEALQNPHRRCHRRRSAARCGLRFAAGAARPGDAIEVSSGRSLLRSGIPMAGAPIDGHRCSTMEKSTMAPQFADLDLRLIRVFLAIVDAGGLSAAQRTLNVGQPTLSSQLATLETRLGFSLCARGRG